MKQSHKIKDKKATVKLETNPQKTTGKYRALVNIEFSIPEKNHLKVMNEIVGVLHKARARDFNFIKMVSDRFDGMLEYNEKKQPEIDPKKMKKIRTKNNKAKLKK